MYLYNLFDGCDNCCGIFIFIRSAVQKFMDHEVVTTYEISLMYIISTSSITFPCVSIISVGSLWIVVVSHEVLLNVILPLVEILSLSQNFLGVQNVGLGYWEFGDHVLLCILDKVTCTASNYNISQRTCEYSIGVLHNSLFRFIVIYCVNKHGCYIIFNIREEQALLGLNDQVVLSALYTSKPSFRVLLYFTLCFCCKLLKDKIFTIPSG